jgi:transposase-like protein
MSCKTKIAYLKLLRALVSLLGPFGTLRLVAVSLDFESGLWGAFSTVFPNVSFRGCSFHFSQAVFRQIQKCGLANLYRRNERIRRICRKLMALNLLPHRFIPRLFRDLKTQVRGALTRSLFDYMEKTWLNSTVWRPKSWSVFMQPIRTNSPIESYHSRLKRLAKKPHLNLYLLIELLHTESQMVPFKSFLLATDKLAENQKKSTSHFTSTLFAYWENFNTGKYGSVETLYEDLTDLISDNYKYNFNHNI